MVILENYFKKQNIMVQCTNLKKYFYDSILINPQNVLEGTESKTLKDIDERYGSQVKRLSKITSKESDILKRFMKHNDLIDWLVNQMKSKLLSKVLQSDGKQMIVYLEWSYIY